VGVDVNGLIGELSKRQLVELDACVHCTECAKWCPVTQVEEDYANTPMDKIAVLKSFVQRTKGPLRFFKNEVTEEELTLFADQVYRCSTCGRCGVVCPVGINCQELWPTVRGGLVKIGYGPVEKINESREILERTHNPFDFQMAERNNWMEDFKPKEKAELCFFVGCELAYRITPMATGALQVFSAGKADFTVSDDEWCCGYPLFVLGDRSEEIRVEIEHNIEKLKETGAKRVAASCPCCYGMLQNRWKDYYGELPFEVIHVLNVADELLKAGTLKFTKPYKGGPVAYHDPCYLSRGWGEGDGVIEEPRNILRAIKGLELVELPNNKRLSRCPGSGGGIRRACPELSEQMAKAFINEVRATGVRLLLTSCPAVYERVTHILSKEPEHKIEEDAPWGVDDGETESNGLRVMDILDFASRHL
jgi:heterodisulfide reductase subunit D